MSKTSFTPGPWKVTGGIKGRRLFAVAYAKDPSDPKRKLIVDKVDETHPIKEHNQRLFADFKLRNLAPEMYEILDGLMLSDTFKSEFPISSNLIQQLLNRINNGQ